MRCHAHGGSSTRGGRSHESMSPAWPPVESSCRVDAATKKAEPETMHEPITSRRMPIHLGTQNKQ